MKKNNIFLSVIVLFLTAFLFLNNVEARSKSDNINSSTTTVYSAVNCGGETGITNIPKKIPQLTSLFITVAEVIVPIVFVIVGSIDLIKAITAQKEDEIKKAQNLFFKRLIIAAVVFFVVAIARLLVSAASSATGGNGNSILSCVDCFVSNKCN